MIIVKAKARYIRVSPRKVRRIINLIRGESVNRALSILTHTNSRPRIFIEKALRSAISNARQNPQVATDQLLISKIFADKGPTLKRYRAAAMGRATLIQRRTTHLTVELSGREPERPKLNKRQGQKKLRHRSLGKIGLRKAKMKKTAVRKK